MSITPLRSSPVVDSPIGCCNTSWLRWPWLWSLGIGILGYRVFAGFTWIDSLLNAAMLLGGMGPVGDIPTTAGKLFASFYALYAGLVLIAASGILLAPALHRVLHGLHLEGKR
jgi:hypothetical protein